MKTSTIWLTCAISLALFPSTAFALLHDQLHENNVREVEQYWSSPRAMRSFEKRHVLDGSESIIVGRAMRIIARELSLEKRELPQVRPVTEGLSQPPSSPPPPGQPAIKGPLQPPPSPPVVQPAIDPSKPPSSPGASPVNTDPSHPRPSSGDVRRMDYYMQHDLKMPPDLLKEWTPPFLMAKYPHYSHPIDKAGTRISDILAPPLQPKQSWRSRFKNKVLGGS